MPVDKKKKARKVVVDTQNNESNITDTSRPADFSFHKYKRLERLDIPKARENRVGTLPQQDLMSKKYMTRALWLNNNKLSNMQQLDVAMESVIEHPERLRWLDFSYNNLKAVDKGILIYKEMAVLYFHGNNIADFESIAQLRNLKRLRKITFSGNPIAYRPDYRRNIIHLLPQIKHLDNVPILKGEHLAPLDPHARLMLMGIMGNNIDGKPVRSKKPPGKSSEKSADNDCVCCPCDPVIGVDTTECQ